MGIHVNLLQNRKDYSRFESFLTVTKITTLVIGLSCFFGLVGIFLLKGRGQSTLTQLTNEQRQLVQSIQSQEDKEAQILLIQEKIDAIDTILKEAPDYAGQVETILAFMPQASASGALKSLAIDENAAEIIVAFPQLQSLTAFLDTIDSPVFQKTFSDIELSSIAYADPEKELRVQLNVAFGKTTD